MSDDGIARDGMRRGELAVVTGGGGGFGRAFVRRFARDGAKVAVWEIDAEAGNETVEQVTDAGGEARFFPVDLSQPGQIEAAVKGTLDAYGSPYCLIGQSHEQGKAHDFLRSSRKPRGGQGAVATA